GYSAAKKDFGSVRNLHPRSGRTSNCRGRVSRTARCITFGVSPMNPRTLAFAAAALAARSRQAPAADDKAGGDKMAATEKCYGVAPAGKNDCAGAGTEREAAQPRLAL